MWGSLLVLALLTTINPVRLGIILLVLSRPRPVQNLLAYWAGAVLIGLASLVIPLIVLHSNPASSAFAKRFAQPTADPLTQRITIGVGVALLAIAAYLLTRSALRKPVAAGSRQRPAADSGGTTSTLVDDSGAPPALTRLLYSTSADGDADPKSGRLTDRVRQAWQNGSAWISFFIGVIVVPPLDGLLFALAIVVASGASFEMQLIALIVFVFGVLLVEEVILVSNLVVPSRTQAALRKLHEWANSHRQAFGAAICVVVGASLVLRGLGSL
ncbi:GAP family protein [Mycolicibacterium sp. 050232]|uniref:GAP family protein n=1 Tax=Mycolicibacterium sp. 050232 TaxID=3113982 RepID=UPI002E291A86|nr:GAP family protein [Mycolicibacterium sp. 050232]MED5814929.1 GAP family protein [Mycolicibacterium sp. 050232]